MADSITDHWAAFDDKKTAEKKFEQIINEDGTYSVSLVKTIRSTDYDIDHHLVIWSKYVTVKGSK